MKRILATALPVAAFAASLATVSAAPDTGSSDTGAVESVAAPEATPAKPETAPDAASTEPEAAEAPAEPGAEEATVAVQPTKSRTRFELRVGPAWNFGGRITGRWNPSAVRRMVSASYGSTSVRNSVPSATGFADRDYVDGFVHLDEGTTDPDTMIYGTTWNWGYDNASQYDGSTVSFHSDPVGSSSSVRPLDAAPVEDDEDVDFLGIDVQGRLPLGEWLRGESGLLFGFRWFDCEKVDFDRSAAIVRESHSSYRYVDVYDAQWPGFPSAPYANDVTGPGYLLDNQPLYRTTQSSGGSSSTWLARSRAEVEMDKLDLRLGLTQEWRPVSWLGLEIQPQLAVAYVDLSADVETTVTAGRSTKLHRIDHGDKDAWVWGAGIEATLAADLGRGWSLAASAAWDAWFDDVKVAAGPYDIKAELGEWTVALAFGKEF